MEDHTFYRKVDAILDEQEDNIQNSGSDSGSEDDGPDDNQYVVEAIVDDRVVGHGQVEYLIKWDGYDSEDNTWEPARNLKPETIKEYEDSKRSASKSKKAKLEILNRQRNKKRNFTTGHEILDKSEIQPKKKLPLGWQKTLDSVVDIRKIGDEINVVAKWKDNSLTFQSIKIFKKSNPQALLDFYYKIIFEDLPISNNNFYQSPQNL